MNRLRYNPPINEEDFELLCLHLLRKARECSNLKRNGRRGHRQYGVDLIGETGSRVIGVQCKLTSILPITRKQITSETEKARDFEPRLGHFIIATSSQRDPHLQRFVLDLSLAYQADERFSIELLFWNDLEEYLHFHGDVRDKLYGGVASEQVSAILSSVNQVRAAIETSANDHRQLAEHLLNRFEEQRVAFKEQSELTKEELGSIRELLTSAIERVSNLEQKGAKTSPLIAVRESGDAADLLKTLLDQRGRASNELVTLNREIASVAYVTGNASIAEEALRAILSIFPLDVASLNQLGRTYAEQGQWNEAEEHFRRVVDIGEKNTDSYTQAMGYSNLGLVFRSAGQLDQSEFYFRRALRLMQEIGDKEQVAAILAKIGSLYHMRSQYEQARRYYRRAIRIARVVRPSAMYLPLHYLANLYQHMGDSEKSERMFRKLIAVADPNDRREMAYLLGNLANTLAAQSKSSEAKDAFGKALELDSSIGNSRGVSRHLCNLAMVHYCEEEFDEAEALLTESLDSANRIGDYHLAAVTLGNLAEVLLEKALKGTEDFARVEYIAQQGLALSEKVDSADLVARKQLTLGRIYTTLGLKEEAKKWFESARDTFLKLGLTHMVEATNEMLGYC